MRVRGLTSEGAGNLPRVWIATGPIALVLIAGMFLVRHWLLTLALLVALVVVL